MMDGDPQCNLTEISVKDVEELAGGQLNLFGDQVNFDLMTNNVYEYFKLYIEPMPDQTPIKVTFYEKKERLNLIPGAIHFAEVRRNSFFGAYRVGSIESCS